jgi:DNA-binding response OmpR family regulator
VKILVVDDDLDLLGLVAYALRQAGFLVVESSDGREALEVFEREEPDLCILDVNLPRLSGFEILGRLRESRPSLPIMMLTVRSAEEDQVKAFDLGADDYLTKPFSPRTLLARVRALLRRAGPDASPIVAFGDLALDPDRRDVRIAEGSPVRLTPLEFRLLQALAAHAGRAVPPERLIVHVWGAGGRGDRQLLKQLVRRVRTKIEADPSLPTRLLTDAGLGYRLAATRSGDGPV